MAGGEPGRLDHSRGGVHRLRILLAEASIRARDARDAPNRNSIHQFAESHDNTAGLAATIQSVLKGPGSIGEPGPLRFVWLVRKKSFAESRRVGLLACPSARSALSS